jgi:2-oxoglutarate ferredoxin oxidoreductase subunit alpha
MQLTGGQFTRPPRSWATTSPRSPTFPPRFARPPAPPGVSAFQINFSSFDIHNPGDQVRTSLVAMNPAALKVHIGDLKPNGIVILNSAKFGSDRPQEGEVRRRPAQDGSLDAFRVVEIDLEKLTREALATSPLDTAREGPLQEHVRARRRLYWLYNRDMQPTLDSIEQKFGQRNRDVADANHRRSESAGHFVRRDHRGLPDDLRGAQGDRDRLRAVPQHHGQPGRCASASIAASHKSGLPIMLGSYPITPASDILHQLGTYKNHGVMTFQAEDEIAAVCAAIGASYAGQIAVTSTSGPGLALKTEAVGLAVMTELPLVIVNVQRGGPEHRPADQDRAGRPAAGALRPKRRVPARR